MKKLLVLFVFLFAARSVCAVTYTTWNPSNAGPSLSLTSGNLTVTNTVGGWNSVSAIQGLSSGKWYWEVNCGTASASSIIIGVMNASGLITSYIGTDANEWGYWNSGQKMNNGGTAYGATYTSGNIVGIALDMGAGTIEFFLNNVSQGVAFTGLTGTLYPAVSINSNADNVTANFGATALTYSPPTGFNAGVYSGTSSNINSINGLLKASIGYINGLAIGSVSSVLGLQ